MFAALLKRLFGSGQPRAKELGNRPEPVNPDACREALRAGNLDAAVDCFRSHLAGHPDDAAAHNDLGVALQRLRRYREALDCFETVIRLAPADVDAWYNAGVIHHLLRDVARAEDCYGKAISAGSADPEAHRGYSMLRLLRGDFATEVWSSFRRRRLCAGFEPSSTGSTAPLWNGEPAEGKTVLVYGEQGLGDEIMFASCYPDLVARAGHCVIETEPRLEALFRRSFANATVLGRNRENDLAARYPSVAYQLPCGDLPLYFRSSAADFAGRAPYLKANSEAVERWRSALAGLGPGLKIGISWRGGTPKNNQAGRTIGLKRWGEVLRATDARFVSLQYGDCSEDLAQARNALGVELHHWPEAIADYDETAALVSALDLVITVTTSVAHLAGALGQKTWILVNAAPRWCYLASGNSMPWYPTARLFRQQYAGAWDDIMNQVARALAAFRT
jgi:tetratricopeptide (TPR) repeat protein